MQKYPLIFTSKFGRYNPGDKASLNSVESKVLVALNKARYDDLPIYAHSREDFTIAQSKNLEPLKKEIIISDSVKNYAEENQIDYNSIVGTGKDGRINRNDIELAISQRAGANVQETNQ